jgi:hypothetical protein
VCPKCGSAAAVHSIEEWAATAQVNMGYLGQPGAPMPGYPAAPAPPPGYPQAGSPQAGSPQAGYPQAGYPQAPQPGPGPQSGFPDPSQYQQSGFPDPSQYQQPGSPGGPQQQPPPSPAEPQPTQQPGYQGGPPPGQPPGYQPGPQPDYLPGPEQQWPGQPSPGRRSWDSGSGASTFEDAIGEVVGGVAAKAIGRVIGRKMRKVFDERVAPAMAAARGPEMQQRMAIAQRHPDLRACLNDQVIFLVGGTRTLPLASAAQVRTVEQSDALVAQLRGG